MSRIIKMLLVLIALLIFSEKSVDGEEFSVTSSQPSVEKGEVFDLYLKIETDEVSIRDIKIDLRLPLDFKLQNCRGIKIEELDSISAGSSVSLIYRIQSPSYLLNPFGGSRGVSTRDPKKFIFNISYMMQPSGMTRQRQVEFSLRYTTSMYIYLLWGLLGLLLAHVIKTLAKNKSEEVKETINLVKILRFIFIENIVGLLTTLLIGFAVFIILAQNMVPTRGWYDTLALGIILGMLGDENLLKKLKGT